MAVSARQLKPGDRALIDNVGTNVTHPRFGISVHKSLDALYRGLLFVTDAGTGVSPGFFDHGALGGLLDDDHPGYLLLATSRGTQTVASTVIFSGPVTTSALLTADHIVIDNATATDALLKLIPHGSQSAEVFQQRDSADTLSRIATTARGGLTLTPADGNARVVTMDLTDNSAAGTSTGLWDLNVTLDRSAIGSGTLVGTDIFRIDATLANLRTASYRAMNITLSADSDATFSPTIQGMLFGISSQGSNNFATLTAMSGTATHNSTGTLTTQTGLSGNIAISGGGTVTNASSFITSIVAASGTITNLYGFRVATPTTGATITNFFGLHIAAITGATNNWAIFSAGGQSRHFGGMQHSYEPIDSALTDGVATVADNFYWHMVDHTTLTGTQSIVLEGDAILQVT